MPRAERTVRARPRHEPWQLCDVYRVLSCPDTEQGRCGDPRQFVVPQKPKDSADPQGLPDKESSDFSRMRFFRIC